MCIAQLFDSITLVTTEPPAARDVMDMLTGHGRLVGTLVCVCEAVMTVFPKYLLSLDTKRK